MITTLLNKGCKKRLDKQFKIDYNRLNKRKEVNKIMRKTKANTVEQITYGMCAFFLLWGVASWFDVIANNMNGAHYQWWNLIVMIFG